MARILSVDMVRSANTTYQMACSSACGAGDRDPAASLASPSTFQAIQSTNRPPASFRYSSVSRRAASSR